MVLSMKRSLKKGGVRRSNKKSRTRSGKQYRGNPSFAAKLAAFILEGLKDKKIKFSKTGGFSDSQKQVSGVLPYLHMNINEKNVVNKFKETQKMRVGGLAKICKKKGLERTLSSVDFSCDKQSKNGVISVNKSIIDSINNRWSIRHNGRKHLREIKKYMTWQVKNGVIPPKSVEWAKNM